MAKNFIEDIGFGAQGSTYANTGSNAITPPTGLAYTMIQIVTDTVFSTLTAESDTTYISTSGTGGGTNGANVQSVTFSKGMIIYGRWTSIDLTSGSVIAYISN